jgi:hypothetical protein
MAKGVKPCERYFLRVSAVADGMNMEISCCASDKSKVPECPVSVGQVPARLRPL